jgi:N6-adenosine-specific RNA methylase IME4
MAKVYDIVSGNEVVVNTLPEQTFNLIYCDPPWSFKTWGGKGTNRSAENHYNTMSLDDIANLPIGDIADENCALAMWTTDPHLQNALYIMNIWGFTYKTILHTWVKVNKDQSKNRYFKGTGYYTRSNPECLLLGMKGKMKRQDKNIDQVIVEPRREHSRKPDIVRTNLVKLFGDVPRIELFARESFDGWSSWGNETEKFNDEELEIEVELE